MPRLKISDILKLYKEKKKITCLSLYDSCFAQLADLCDIPILLVGDSLGTTILGYKDTIDVKIDDCLRHSAAVVRGSKKAFVVGDLPFLAYHSSLDTIIETSRRFIQEAKVSALKLEGGGEYAPIIKSLISAGVPMMGHLGIFPQRVRLTEGYKIRGKNEEEVKELLKNALELQKAGVFALVLEGVKSKTAKLITDSLDIPTIGIGAGPDCNGQIQVIHDILGLSNFSPKHAKKFAKLKQAIVKAIKTYKNEVENSTFPTQKESF